MNHCSHCCCCIQRCHCSCPCSRSCLYSKPLPTSAPTSTSTSTSTSIFTTIAAALLVGYLIKSPHVDQTQQVSVPKTKSMSDISDIITPTMIDYIMKECKPTTTSCTTTTCGTTTDTAGADSSMNVKLNIKNPKECFSKILTAIASTGLVDQEIMKNMTEKCESTIDKLEKINQVLKDRSVESTPREAADVILDEFLKQDTL